MSVYDTFYGGSGEVNKCAVVRATQFLIPSFGVELLDAGTTLAEKRIPVFKGEDKLALKVTRVVANLLVLLLFVYFLYPVVMWVIIGTTKDFKEGTVANTLLNMYKSPPGLVIETRPDGFEAMGAAGAGYNRQSHLGSLDGQMYAQDIMQRDRFTSGSEPPVFYDSPNYVVRKEDLLKRAIRDYVAEKGGAVGFMPFKQWFTMNSGRYGDYGEGEKLAAFMPEHEGMRSSLGLRPMMDLY